MTALSKYPTIPVPPDAHRDLVRDAYARANGADIGEAIAAIVGEAFALWRAEQERKARISRGEEPAFTVHGVPVYVAQPGELPAYCDTVGITFADGTEPGIDKAALRAMGGEDYAEHCAMVEQVRRDLADGTAPGTSPIPDDGAWLVAAPVTCRVTGLETRECACSGCSGARRRKG